MPLLALTAVMVLSIGQSGMAAVVFLAVVSVLCLSTTQALLFVVTLAVLVEVSGRTVPGWSPTSSLTFAVCTAAFAMWGVQQLMLRNADLLRAKEENAELAVADGALGVWKALPEVWPKTREQRCWVHKTANVLNRLPNSLQGKAKRALQNIWMAETRKDAETAFDTFAEIYGTKYDKAVECLTKDRNVLLAFYDFPAEHWKHLRTTNIIERCFVEVRRRTRPMVCFVNVKSVDRIIYSIFQRFNLLPTLSAMGNIEIAHDISALGATAKRDLDKPLLDHLTDMLGIKGRLDHRPNELSGGEQQRVAIARALINRPAIVLADEPTGNLDTRNSDAVLKMLRKSSRELNQTVLMITHNPEAAQIADRILHMRDGEITHIEDGKS